MSSADNSSPEPPRSRSASRRRRRQKQSQKSQNPMPALEESQAEDAGKEMQAFDRIGGPETSMNGPITKARADRGEIPQRRGEPMPEGGMQTKEQGGESDMMQKDGLKLRVELNLDVEIELKASIRGDLTIALL